MKRYKKISKKRNKTHDVIIDVKHGLTYNPIVLTSFEVNLPDGTTTNLFTISPEARDAPLCTQLVRN